LVRRKDEKSFVVLLLASLLLSACAGAAPSTPATGTEPPAGGVTEITFMMWGAPEELTVWQAVVDDFHAANPGIKVNVDVSDWDSYWTKLNTLIAGGTPPDVFAMDAPLFLDWQSRGALLNLQPYIDANPGFLDGFYPQTLTAYKDHPTGILVFPVIFNPSSCFTTKRCSMPRMWLTPLLTGPMMI